MANGALIQTAGRAARNREGRVILYGDRVTDSMRIALEETARRRKIQKDYNSVNGITPETIKKRIHDLEYQMADADYVNVGVAAEEEERYRNEGEIENEIGRLEKEMKAAAKKLEFERAARLRDKIRSLRQKELEVGG